MSPTYFEMSQKESENDTGHELRRINELRSNSCTLEADSLISESLKKTNLSVPFGVQIRDWDAIDRFEKLVNSARIQENILFLRHALSDYERIVRQQVVELQSNPLVVFDWDDGHELLTTIAEKLKLNH